MDNIDLYESQRYYRRGVDFTTRSVDRILDRFRESLGDWLHGALNWPESDWEADLAGFIEHTHYAGLNIAPESQSMLRELLAARARGTGVFADLAERDAPAEKPSIQLAAIGFAGDQDTDAELNYSEEDLDEVEEETAGPGPATSPAFQERVRQILDILDPVVAKLWRQHQGRIRSRPGPWYDLFFAYEITRIDGRPAIIVKEYLSAPDIAIAILEAAYASGSNPINSLFLERKLLTAEKIEERYNELQTEAFRQASAEAAMLAELYYGAIGSLTPAGDLVVTIDDVNRNGFRFEHLLIALPMMAYFRKGIKRLLIKLPGGRVLQIPGKLLERLGKLLPDRRKRLIAKAQAAKTKEEALAIIEKGVAGATPSGPAQPKRKKVPHPTKAPSGKWIKVNESMSARARAYQSQVTSRTGQAYFVAGVKFDGHRGSTLLEAKGPGYVNFVAKNDDFYSWFRRKQELLLQARHQIVAAAGNPIEWHIAEPELKAALEKLFEREQVHGITLIHTKAR